jgi:hypothetical protein
VQSLEKYIGYQFQLIVRVTLLSNTMTRSSNFRAPGVPVRDVDLCEALMCKTIPIEFNGESQNLVGMEERLYN